MYFLKRKFLLAPKVLYRIGVHRVSIPIPNQTPSTYGSVTFLPLNMKNGKSFKIKRASLSQGALRRLRNIRPDKIVEKNGKLLTDMAEGMMRSGYPEG